MENIECKAKKNDSKISMGKETKKTKLHTHIHTQKNVGKL